MSSVPKSKRKCSDNHNAMDLAQDIRATLNKYILQDFGVYNKKLLDYKDGYGFKFDILFLNLFGKEIYGKKDNSNV